MSRIAWLGSPAASATCLSVVHESGHEITVVITEPDRRRGRGGALVPTPVKVRALELGLPVAHSLDDLAGSRAEIGIVVAFGRIIPGRVLEELRMLNVHFSLLPRWRGAAPVERAILAGDPITGVCLMEVEAGLDTGGIYARAETPVEPAETATALTARLAGLGAGLLVSGLSDGVAGLGEPAPQVGEVTYAHKVSVEERRLDFGRSAVELERVVRIGRAWTTWRSSRLLVHEARVVAAPSAGVAAPGIAAPGAVVPVPDGAMPGQIIDGRIVTGDGWLVPVTLQPEGRRPQDATEWLRNTRPGEREVLGGPPERGPGDTVA